MGTTITLAADIITITLTGDGIHTGCTYDELIDWYGVDGVDMGFVKRPGAPGAFAPEQTYPDEAVITIKRGQYFGMDRADALSMREDLTALYNEGRPIVMTVADDLRTTSREVLVEAIKFPWTIHAEFEFDIDMRAADPRRYGDPITVSTPLAAPGSGLQLPYDEVTGVGLLLPSDETPTPDLGLDLGTTGVDGRITITNAGNTETFTVFTVTDGDMPDGFEIVNVETGQRLPYVGPLVSGTVVTIDSGTQAAFINDITPSRYLASPQWWADPPRASYQVAFLARGPVTGTPTLTATTSPAFY